MSEPYFEDCVTFRSCSSAVSVDRILCRSENSDIIKLQRYKSAVRNWCTTMYERPRKFSYGGRGASPKKTPTPLRTKMAPCIDKNDPLKKKK